MTLAAIGGTIAITVAAFLTLILALVALLLFTKEKLAPSGPVKILLNGEREIEVASGDSLLTTLGNQKIFLPSACGGGGSCIQCECHVLAGGGEALPTETPHFSKKELQGGARLACQVKVKQDMEITIPEEVFGIKKWQAKVVRNYNVASFIKEFVVEIPEEMNYKAGGYIQIEIPPCEVRYADMDITAHPEEHETPMKFKAEWDKFKLCAGFKLRFLFGYWMVFSYTRYRSNSRENQIFSCSCTLTRFGNHFYHYRTHGNWFPKFWGNAYRR